MLLLQHRIVVVSQRNFIGTVNQVSIGLAGVSEVMNATAEQHAHHIKVIKVGGVLRGVVARPVSLAQPVLNEPCNVRSVRFVVVCIRVYLIVLDL